MTVTDAVEALAETLKLDDAQRAILFDVVYAVHLDSFQDGWWECHENGQN